MDRAFKNDSFPSWLFFLVGLVCLVQFVGYKSMHMTLYKAFDIEFIDVICHTYMTWIMTW